LRARASTRCGQVLILVRDRLFLLCASAQVAAVPSRVSLRVVFAEMTRGSGPRGGGWRKGSVNFVYNVLRRLNPAQWRGSGFRRKSKSAGSFLGQRLTPPLPMSSAGVLDVFASGLGIDATFRSGSLYQHRGALRGTPGSACPQPEPNATELPRSAPGHPKLIKLQATKPAPTPTRTEEQIATTPVCGPVGRRAFAHADTQYISPG